MISFLTSKQKLWMIAAIVSGGLVATTLLLTPRSPELASPSVAWVPSSILESIPAGQTATIPVSFTALKDLSDLVVRISPEVEPFIVVNPGALGNVSEGDAVAFNIAVDIPVGTVPGTVEGTVQLKAAGATKKTYAPPLSVTLLISAPLTINIGAPSVSPEEALTNTPTDVIVRMTIAHPNVLSADVIRVDESGQALAVMGALNDDGTDGDDIAEDEQYAGTVIINEPSPGELFLNVEVVVDAAPPATSGITSVTIVNANTRRWPTVENEVLRISYPPNWTAQVKELRIELEEPEPVSPIDPSGDVVIALVPNPSELGIADYYNGMNDTDYFNDASTIEDVMVDGHAAKLFSGVIGLTGSNVVIIPITGHFIEVIDGVGTSLFATIVDTIEIFD